MSRITVSLDEQSKQVIEERAGEDGAYDSKSAVVRDCVKEYERVEELEEELEAVREQCEQLRKRAERVEELETEIERVRREKRQLLQEREEKAQLAQYVEDERRVEQKWREAPLWTRVKWRIVGMPSG
jgi:Arc/MetJ-type ribon-helix-helix transcriptional regulator